MGLWFRKINPAATLGYTGVAVSDQNPLPVTIVDSGGVPINVPPSENRSGQVKANYTGVTLSNFAVQTNKVFDLSAGTHTLSTAPTTTWPTAWPNPAGSVYDPDFYNSVTTRLRENNVSGQVSTWRIDGMFANKASGNNGALIVEIFNPDSGFTNTQVITLSSGITTGQWTVNLMTIADGASLPAGLGYRVRARTSFADTNLTVNINSIARISQATENVRVS